MSHGIVLTEAEREALVRAVKILNGECFNYTAEVIESLLARAIAETKEN